MPGFFAATGQPCTAKMDSATLTKEQQQLAGAADRARRFYAQLVRRMEAQGFPLDDPLYRLAIETRNQTERLWIDLHRST